MLAMFSGATGHVIQNGGTSVFVQTLEFIVLVLFASAAVAGVTIARRMSSVVALRAKLEAKKTDRMIKEVEHAIEVEQHQYGQKVLALTVGEKIEAPPEHVKGEVMPEPFNGAENAETYRLRQRTVEGEFEAAR
jgi:hypothetical protein